MSERSVTGRPLTWRSLPALGGGFAVTLVSALVVICMGRGRRDTPGMDRVLRSWAGACLRAYGARVVVHGTERLELAGPCIVVANHQSGLDPITQIKALPLSLRIMAMTELFQIAVLGRALRTVGMIEVDRESPSLRAIVEGAAQALAAGHSLLVFPEGKISVDGSVGEFKNGAFLMAVMNQVPVLPVAISGSNKVWPAVGRAIRSGTVHVVVGSPLATQGLTRRDVPALRDQAREAIISACRELAKWLAQWSRWTRRCSSLAAGRPGWRPRPS
ncbi:MAG TPA: lysophospholipid acyltransferase family protein [Streptosporangiaceae bacterium]|nr:lysophospholipid acyltransferase family protein [Streptosporangiaceae bacterium]